jgi:transposase
MERDAWARWFDGIDVPVSKLDDFVPKDHPSCPIRTWLNDALKRMDDVFARIYEADAKGGRPSVAPEKLVRALLLQVLYSNRRAHAGR